MSRYARLARLRVEEKDGTFYVATTNVIGFSIRGNDVLRLSIDGIVVPVVYDDDGVVRLLAIGLMWLVRAFAQSSLTFCVQCMSSPAQQMIFGRLHSPLTEYRLF